MEGTMTAGAYDATQEVLELLKAAPHKQRYIVCDNDSLVLFDQRDRRDVTLARAYKVVNGRQYGKCTEHQSCPVHFHRRRVRCHREEREDERDKQEDKRQIVHYPTPPTQTPATGQQRLSSQTLESYTTN